MLKAGQKSHSREIGQGVVRLIIASRTVVTVQKSTLAPHSVRRCSSVYVAPFFKQASVVMI